MQRLILKKVLAHPHVNVDTNCMHHTQYSQEILRLYSCIGFSFSLQHLISTINLFVFPFFLSSCCWQSGNIITLVFVFVFLISHWQRYRQCSSSKMLMWIIIPPAFVYMITAVCYWLESDELRCYLSIKSRSGSLDPIDAHDDAYTTLGESLWNEINQQRWTPVIVVYSFNLRH